MAAEVSVHSWASDQQRFQRKLSIITINCTVEPVNMETKETRQTIHIIWVSVLSRFSEKSTPDTHFFDLETNAHILAKNHCLIF